MLSRSSSAYQPLGGASDTNRQRHDHTEVRSYRPTSSQISTFNF